MHAGQCTQQTTLNPDSYHVLPGYFSTVGQTILVGRGFTSADNGSHHVAIVNRLLAEREWPGQSAIGHRIKTGDIEDWATVVGVVGTSTVTISNPLPALTSTCPKPTIPRPRWSS